MLKRHLGGVLRFVKHPITNGVAEGLNSKIMSINRKPAAASASRRNFTTAMDFHCGGSISTQADLGRDHFLSWTAEARPNLVRRSDHFIALGRRELLTQLGLHLIDESIELTTRSRQIPAIYATQGTLKQVGALLKIETCGDAREV